MNHFEKRIVQEALVQSMTVRGYVDATGLIDTGRAELEDDTVLVDGEKKAVIHTVYISPEHNKKLWDLAYDVNLPITSIIETAIDMLYTDTCQPEYTGE